MKKVFLFLLFITSISRSNAQLTKEQDSIKNIFFDFIKFYQKNEKKFNSFQLYKGAGEKNNPPYHVQWKEVDRYFAWLRTDVPYVGEEYIKNEQWYFKYVDSCLKSDFKNDISVYFGFDRWTELQKDVSDTLKWYFDPNTKYEVEISADKAMIRIESPGIWEKYHCISGLLLVPFIKEKDTWKIAENNLLICN